MKCFLCILITICLYGTSKAQIKKPSSEAINEFSSLFYYYHHYAKNGTIRSIAYYAGMELNYSYVDIEIAVEQLNKNRVFREKVFKWFYQLFKDEEMMTLQLSAFGMRPSFAKDMSRYIVTKYQAYQEEKLDTTNTSDTEKGKNDTVQYKQRLNTNPTFNSSKKAKGKAVMRKANEY